MNNKKMGQNKKVNRKKHSETWRALPVDLCRRDVWAGLPAVQAAGYTIDPTLHKDSLWP